MSKNVVETMPSPPVFGILRQSSLEVGNRLIREFQGFFVLADGHQSPANVPFKTFDSGRREDFLVDQIAGGIPEPQE